MTDSTGASTATPQLRRLGRHHHPSPHNPTAAVNRYGYASGYTDPGTGLIRYGTRYYAPLLGVWTQSDPASQGANYYIYAGSDPITNTDPTGRWSWDDTFDAVSTGLGAIGTGLDVLGAPEVGVWFSGASVATDFVKAGYDEWGGGDDSAEGDLGAGIVGAATFGTGQVADQSDSEGVEIGADIAGNANDGWAASGGYEDDDE